MTDIEKVILQTRKIESLLRLQYHAEGKSLDELITSCEERLPHDVIDKLRYVAMTYDKVVHEDEFQPELGRQFLSVCHDCEKELTPRSGRFIWRVAISLMALITVMAIAFYYAHWDELTKHIIVKP
ncbi:DUF4145 domain-containing protein [Vibrio sp. S4M6]|uniref:DUF4145 domain-containing protein n=1 Tax=Vibrio sinus TaxID=2946865 RepID=UPI00202A9D9A|nr:DUF4145 domain-containing protein [Vibrio sinus]MCL9783561.1 DUF4145 domain-containing protein [Vibrio sinus]